VSHPPAPTTRRRPDPASSSPLRARPHWLRTLPMMLGSGALLAVQSQVNGALADSLGTGLRAGTLAALISFGSGLAVLSGFALAHPPTRQGVAGLLRGVRRRTVPHWLVLGGLGGAFFVVSQGLAAGALGITFFVLCFVAGQAVTALLVDHRGWGPQGATALSGMRVTGAGLALLAVGISGAGLAAAVALTAALVLLAALPLLAGSVNSVQQGMNGRLATRFGPWVTTWNNFAVGTLGLSVFLAAALAAPGRIVGLPPQPWLYLGGLCGIGFIWASTVTVRVHGVLVVGVFAVAGQVLAAAVMAAAVSGSAPPPATLLAALTSLAGAAVVGLSTRGPSPAA